VPLPGENPSAEVRMAAIVHGYDGAAVGIPS